MEEVLFKPQIDPAGLAPQVLAYLGDAVYELMVRQYLVGLGPGKVDTLHRKTVQCVRAETQARVLRALLDRLSPEERDIVRRGRNAKTGPPPKNASPADYRYSTGLESLVGYLYLNGETRRLQEIIEIAATILNGE